MQRSLSSIFFFTVFVILSTGTAAKADRWYPSPTGWRGPIRDAGRPWLRGTPYAPPGERRPVITKKSEVRPYVADVWYWDETRRYYWQFESSTQVYWYYFPATGTYAR